MVGLPQIAQIVLHAGDLALKIIDRYIIREFLKVFTICVMGFVLVFLLVEMTDKIKYYFQYNPPGWLMFKYFLIKLPGYLFYAIPLSILLGGMLSLLMMARHSEIIAMQANGIDALNVARPVLLVGAAASLGMFLLNETIIPWSNSYSEYVQNVEIAGKSDTLFKRDQIWIRSPGSITQVRKFDKAEEVLEGVTMVQWDRDYNFLERIYAEKAKWWHNRWVFYGINKTFRAPDGKIAVASVPTMIGALTTPPTDFERAEKPTKEMNLTQLGEYIEKLEKEGQPATRYLVDWHDKIAYPLVCLLMAALSVPFAVKVNPRGGGIATGLAVSLVIAFSYWIVHTMFIALGHGAIIPPMAAAWAGNWIFGLTATILLLQAGT